MLPATLEEECRKQIETISMDKLMVYDHGSKTCAKGPQSTGQPAMYSTLQYVMLGPFDRKMALDLRLLPSQSHWRQRARS